MQHQHDVNARRVLVPGEWAPCGTASIRDDQIVCELDYSRVYDLATAYIRSPHATFVNLKNEPELTDFLREFGPVWPMKEFHLQYYWSFQNWLRALLKLLKAFENSTPYTEHCRAALLGFVQADQREWDVTGLSQAAQVSAAKLLNRHFSFSQDAVKWISEAEPPLVRQAMMRCINVNCRFGVGLQATLVKGKPDITAVFKLDTLHDALEWMIWQDLYRRRPLVICAECGRAFQPRTAHVQKYCQYECAHRVAARTWRRKDLQMQRKRRLRQ